VGKNQKKKRLVWNLEDRHPSLFVAQLVLGSNPKVTKFFKEVNLLVSTYELIHLFALY